MFEGGVSQPPRGSVGLVPQKNVLFPELTCYQTLRLFKTVKPRFDGSAQDEDIVQLLRDCDLGSKIHYNAAELSGGQKRKLQLAIGLVGGSKSAFILAAPRRTHYSQSFSLTVVLVDEVGFCYVGSTPYLESCIVHVGSRSPLSTLHLEDLDCSEERSYYRLHHSRTSLCWST